MHGLPTLQPVSTLTALDGRGRGGASGRTPSRTPCRKTERSTFRQLHSFIEMCLFQTNILANFHLLCANIPSFPRPHPSINIKNPIHPSSPVCILLSHFEPLRSPALLPHADVSPSNRESHFPLSLFPNGGKGGRALRGQMKTGGAKIIIINSCVQTRYLNKDTKAAHLNTVYTVNIMEIIK